MSTTLTETFRCSCSDSFPDMHALGTHHAETAHIGMWLEKGDAPLVDGQPSNIIHDQSLPITVAPMTLAKALEKLDEARDRHADYAKKLKDAKGFEKDAQAWVNTCVNQLLEVARREAEPELPLGLEAQTESEA